MKIHIVGNKHSFTHLASQERYGEPNKFIYGYSHDKLVEKLRNKKISRKEAAVVPVWNSNAGTIDITRRTRTAYMLTGETGTLIDLWGYRIIFALGVKNSGLSKKGRLFSVTVAEQQCSRFFRIRREGTFEPFSTTTDAAKAFSQRAKRDDGLLCSTELLQKHGVKRIKKDVANPYNITMFFTFNVLPRRESSSPNFSLGCIGMDLSGNGLPYEFVDYWKGIAPSDEVAISSNALAAIPKIMFILPYEESKALVLLEMPTVDSSIDPWEQVESGTNLTLFGQVGVTHRPFTADIKELLLKRFGVNRDGVIFYGSGENGAYLWSCPGLDISVHGFNSALVKECAKMQVLRMQSLKKYGATFTSVTNKMLGKNLRELRLATNSHPDTA